MVSAFVTRLSEANVARVDLQRELAVKWTVAALERIMTEYLGEEERVSLIEGGKTEANSEDMIDTIPKRLQKKGW